jgi:oligopeptidase B
MASRSFQSAEWRCLPAATPAGAWRLIHPREKEHEYDVEHRADRFWIRTNGGGRRNFRLVTAPVDDPAEAHWTEEIPHREEVMLEELDLFAHHAVIHEREDGLIRLRVLALETRTSHHVVFPEPTYEVSADANAEFDVRTYRFRYQSLVTPASVYDYEMDRRELTLLKQTPVLGGYDPARYRSERLYAVARDGVRVPISLVYRADTPPAATRPMLLAGYGAYGLPYPVTFSSNRLSLLDRGLSVAIAHIRGGGEGGKRWHDAGRLKHKPNTFGDFIAVADHLVERGYTAHDRLVIEGGSAGGLLIGAVLNARPDLATVAVLRVPFVDVINTMLDESLPLTVGEFEEWGNPKEREYYDVIKSYCPYTNLGSKAYPRVLVKTSLHDSQVMYWEPAKYVAKMRCVAPATPVLFKINMAAGHGGASGRYDYLREIAFDYAYVLTRLGRHA